MLRRLGLALSMAAMLPVPVLGAEPDGIVPTCPATPVLPPELAGWAQAGANMTIDDYRAGDAAEGRVLGAVRTALSLHAADALHYWVAPEKRAAAGKWGGMMPVAVAKAGRLVIALDAGAWIDLVRDGAVVGSVGHGHGPECSGIRKMVEFDVTPGRYLLQIVNAPEASIGAMAVMRD